MGGGGWGFLRTVLAIMLSSLTTLRPVSRWNSSSPVGNGWARGRRAAAWEARTACGLALAARRSPGAGVSRAPGGTRKGGALDPPPKPRPTPSRFPRGCVHGIDLDAGRRLTGEDDGEDRSPPARSAGLPPLLTYHRCFWNPRLPLPVRANDTLRIPGLRTSRVSAITKADAVEILAPHRGAVWPAHASTSAETSCAGHETLI